MAASKTTAKQKRIIATCKVAIKDVEKNGGYLADSFWILHNEFGMTYEDISKKTGGKWRRNTINEYARIGEQCPPSFRRKHRDLSIWDFRKVAIAAARLTPAQQKLDAGIGTKKVLFEAFGCTGSASIAAIRLGHRYIYCELDKKNYAKGCTRLRAAEKIGQTERPSLKSRE